MLLRCAGPSKRTRAARGAAARHQNARAPRARSNAAEARHQNEGAPRRAPPSARERESNLPKWPIFSVFYRVFYNFILTSMKNILRNIILISRESNLPQVAALFRCFRVFPTVILTSMKVFYVILF